MLVAASPDSKQLDVSRESRLRVNKRRFWNQLKSQVNNDTKTLVTINTMSRSAVFWRPIAIHSHEIEVSKEAGVV